MKTGITITSSRPQKAPLCYAFYAGRCEALCNTNLMNKIDQIRSVIEWRKIHKKIGIDSMPIGGESVEGTGMVSNLGFLLKVVVNDQGIYATNINLRFKKPVLISWDQASVIDVKPSKNLDKVFYAKLLMSNPKEVTDFFYVPWSQEFNKYMPKSVGCREQNA